MKPSAHQIALGKKLILFSDQLDDLATDMSFAMGKIKCNRI